MKVKTLSVLAALSMGLTSMSVWSLTKPRDLAAGETELGPKTPSPAVPSVAPSQFSAPGLLSLAGRLGHATLSASEQSETFVFATVRAEGAATQRAGLNLAVVLDRSGSMKGKRLDNALDAARSMIRRLSDGDVLSLIAYDTVTETLLPPTRIDDLSRDRALSALGSVQAKGDTCISCGVDAGMTALRRTQGMVDRILLLSDGEPTAGIKDLEGFRQLAGRARSMNSAVSSVGVDVSYNERVLDAMARESNGTHYFAETPSDVSVAFDKELSTLTKTTARDAEVVVDLEPGVELVRVVDRAFRRENGRIVVPLGTFAEQEEKTVLLRVRVPQGSEGARSVAKLALEYRQPDGTRERQSGELSTTLGASSSELDPAVEERLTRTASADTLDQVNEDLARGDFAGAEKRLKGALSEIRDRKQRVLRRAPAKAAPKLSKSFDKQENALDEAWKELEAAPDPSTESGVHAGAVQRKKNSSMRSAPARL